MANKFIISWEKARGILKPLDPDSDLPYSSALVLAAMFPGTGTRDSDRTQITQYDYALSMDGAMLAAPLLAPGVMGTIATALAVSLPTQPGFLFADGFPPLYIARTDIVPGNDGLNIITAISAALADKQILHDHLQGQYDIKLFH